MQPTHIWLLIACISFCILLAGLFLSVSWAFCENPAFPERYLLANMGHSQSALGVANFNQECARLFANRSMCGQNTYVDVSGVILNFSPAECDSFVTSTNSSVVTLPVEVWGITGREFFLRLCLRRVLIVVQRLVKTTADQIAFIRSSFSRLSPPARQIGCKYRFLRTTLAEMLLQSPLVGSRRSITL